MRISDWSSDVCSSDLERAFRLALIRDVASTYFASREADERIALAEATVRSRQEGLRIAERRLEAGVTSALDFRQAESLLTQAETELASLRLAEAQSENFLAVLLGGPVPVGLTVPLTLADQKNGTVIAAGLPRSEEHTSEPQSLMRISYDVFCLKKKKTTTNEP